jgi:hypothetical protein
MSLHHDNSLIALALGATGLLVTSVVRGLSPEYSLQLAASAPGRVVLHAVCSTRDHRFAWHWQGIRREFKSAQCANRATCA